MFNYTKDNWNRSQYIKDYIKYANKEFEKFAKSNNMTRKEKRDYYNTIGKKHILKKANENADAIEGGLESGMDVFGMR